MSKAGTDPKSVMACPANYEAVIEPCRWLIVKGLEKAAHLNGKCGWLLGDLNPTSRYPVAVQTSSISKTEALNKPENLDEITQSELVQVIRLNSKGEQRTTGFISTAKYPRIHPMFSEASSAGTAPVMDLFGVPLVIQQIPPVVPLRERVDYDNQWATFFMIDPVTGFAPPKWQSFIGPVLVYRPEGMHLSMDDICVLNDVIYRLLDKYGDGDVVPSRDITPRRVQVQKKEWLLNHPGGHLNF